MIHRHRSIVLLCGLAAAGIVALPLWLDVARGAAAPQSAVAATVAAPATAMNSVTVNAGADVSVAPDMATVTFGVLVVRDSAEVAQAAANAVITAAVRNLHALHIPDQRIQTAGISLQPNYDNSGNVTGYQASQTLAVVVFNLRQVGPVVDAGVHAHANNAVSIAFGLRDANSARTAALRLAVGAARTRAQAAAAALDRSLAGARVQLTETGGSTPQPVTAQAPVAASGSRTPAFAGLLTVHEDVTLTYTF